MKKKLFIFILAFALLGGSTLAFFGYRMVMISNFEGDDLEIYVQESTQWTDIYRQLEPQLKNPGTFETWAEIQGATSGFKVGRYIFEEGMSNRVMVNRLLGGLQSPARLQFHHVPSFAHLAGELAADLKPDSLSFYNVLASDSIWESHDIDLSNRLGYIIPNTYEVYWTSTAAEVVSRLIDERRKFWNDDRLRKAQELGLTPDEVTTLASIVQGETYMPDEMPEVAGLYLNRLEKGIRLQSDPTVKYAWELAHPEDIPVQRVLFVMLEWDSPYNTYMIDGLPPGPLAIVEARAIDAVLNPADHDYIFMCADPDRPGYHAFARTVREHEKNRRKFIREQWGR